ncbi:hypothetical protein CAPTEDRAFT_154310 [Capitella teleta]|uniref:RNA helicase n=1 Tax=Capitella teleta TaxID=283909 RepID=R7TE03_CAPTE|nr:hypothetical protein CAPTEDRAFT_154310 [Capitella teleta]|eukprot:ELT91988.1 hypothetical protein CAPTEDRAFT_154310 [Capitella teleta]
MEDDQSFGRGFGDHWKRQGHAGRGRGHGDRGRGHRHYSHGDRGGSEWRGGRGGRGGGGGRGGRGGRGGHPNGLCGREIGLFYAAKSKAKKEMLEKQTRQSLDLNAENERNLSRLLSDVRSEPQAGSSQQDHRQRRPASSDSFEDSWKQYKSRGAQKRREMQTRKKQYVGFSADQAKNITGLVSGEERPCDEEVMQTESIEPKTEEPDFIPLEMDVDLEENILYKDEEDEDMSAFMQEYSRHKEANQQAEGHSTNAYEPVPAEPLLDHQFEEELKVKKQNRQYKEIFNLRKKLKAFKMKKDIVDTINKNQVVVISGDTGCGKTTQVAQFILDDYIQCGRGSNCHIVCTQPRRISAISVAERVAQERVEKCGAGTSSVGYQIRLENQLPRKRGSILYCTTGIVLRHMMGDSWLAGTSHVILDEIHERDLHSDFLMIILKDLMRIRSDLKVILMSATLNAEMFSAYFDNCPMLHIPGFTFHVEEFYLEDIVQEIGYSPKQSQHPNRPIWMRHGKKFQAERAEREKYMSWVIGQRCVFPLFAVEALSKMDFTFADVDLTVSLVVHICRHKPEGAILVFMPGWMEIKKTKEELEKVLSAANTLIIPLHSLLPTCNQKEVFNRPRQGVRKIIIATSIAETSITIDDIVYVVNSGKSKMKDFDPESNIATLQTAWLSRASARQRRGRAGRVQPGECYHLYTRHHEKQLRDYELPEMLRTRLEKLCLDIKMLKLGRIVPFISKAMQPPSMDALQSAANMLLDLNALDDNEDLTPLGYHLATMPLEPQTGKMLLFGAMFSCLNPILTIAASLSFKDAFYKPMDYDPSWVAARRSLADGCKSDHILIAKAFEAWEQACANGNGHQFCRRHFLQQNTLFVRFFFSVPIILIIIYYFLKQK